MNWKQSLDKYLTTPPEDDPFYEDVVEAYTDSFYNKHEDTFIGSEKETELINKFRAEGWLPGRVAELIMEQIS